MKFTGYFEHNVLKRRPEIRKEWLEEAVRNPLKREVQKDGRVKLWIHVKEQKKYLRVVTLNDGTSILNAFFDRNFKG
ncbi:MAG: hypothetical protein AAB740_01385 [Patescibacteria group bacterium]